MNIVHQTVGEMSWYRRCFCLLKTDFLFAFAAAFYLATGLGYVVQNCAEQIPNLHNMMTRHILNTLWAIGVFISILFLYYYERTVPWRRKLAIACTGTLIISLLSWRFPSYFYFEPASTRIILCLHICVSALLAVRSPAQCATPHFDEFHPFRFQVRMMEAGLITGILCIAMFIFCSVLQSMDPLDHGTGPWTKPTFYLFLFLFWSFCPIYVLCRLTDDKASQAQPKILFPNFLAFIFVPLLALALLREWLNPLLAGWFSVTPTTGLSLVASSLAGFLFFYLPESFFDGTTLARKVLKIAKRVTPYAVIPPMLGSIAILMYRYHTSYILSPGDVTAFWIAVALLCLFIVCAVKPRISTRNYIIVSCVFCCIPDFFNTHWANDKRAEQIFIQTLEKHHALNGGPDGDITQVDFKTALSPEEQRRFKDAALVLINRDHSDSSSAKIIQKIVQKQKEIEAQRKKSENPPAEPKKSDSIVSKTSDDMERVEWLLLQVEPLSAEDKKFLDENTSIIIRWREKRHGLILSYFNIYGYTYLYKAGSNKSDSYAYPSHKETIGPFFKKRKTP